MRVRIKRAVQKWLKGQRGNSLALLLIVCSGSLWTSGTNRGVQCPTAPVQRVTESVETVDASGHVTRQTVTHAPRLGDLAFKQCRCAEKKAAKSQQDVAANEGGLSFLALAVAPPVATLSWLRIKDFPTDSPTSPQLSWCSLASSPPTPPPQFS